jgi:hypothetical protein
LGNRDNNARYGHYGNGGSVEVVPNNYPDHDGYNLENVEWINHFKQKKR